MHSLELVSQHFTSVSVLYYLRQSNDFMHPLRCYKARVFMLVCLNVCNPLTIRVLQTD